MSTNRAQRKDPAAVALGRKGGKARLKTMTAKQRSEAAKVAAAARWADRKMAVGGAKAKE